MASRPKKTTSTRTRSSGASSSSSSTSSSRSSRTAKPAATSSSAFRKEKLPAIKARQKQAEKTTGQTTKSSLKNLLARLPSFKTVVDTTVTTIGVILIFCALFAFGSIKFPTRGTLFDGFGEAAYYLFGQTAPAGIVVVFLIGVWMSVIRKIPKSFTFNWRLFGGLSGFYFYILLVLQRINATNNPFESYENGGGAIAAAVDRFSVGAVGVFGTILAQIFLGFLFLFLLWEKFTAILPENLESKLNLTRRIKRNLKAALLIPDEENLTPDADIALQLKPLAEKDQQYAEKESFFQEKLTAILNRREKESVVTMETVDDVEEGLDGQEQDFDANMNETNDVELGSGDDFDLPMHDPNADIDPLRAGFKPIHPLSGAEPATRGTAAGLASSFNVQSPFSASSTVSVDLGKSGTRSSNASANPAAKPGDAMIEAATDELPKRRFYVAPGLKRVVLNPAPAPATVEADPVWTLPDEEEILDPERKQEESAEDAEFIARSTVIIEDILERHDVPGKVVDVRSGPTFTQFGVEPGFIERGGRRIRVRVSQIEKLDKDLAMHLEVSHLKIEAPIPGKTYIGLQVKNPKRRDVVLRQVLAKTDIRKYRNRLPIALGVDIDGAVHTIDLTSMPHLLIAGETGSGKSVCLNSILINLLMYNNPDQLKLILIDPKRVELSGYNGIPHLLTPVITDMDKSSSALQYALDEMDRRNIQIRDMNSRNIQDYNQKYPENPLPYIVIVIDELANLMAVNGPEIEQSITRLAQTARAMGIHLIVATQRPSRETITGTIKGNLPSRIAFHVPSTVDSQVILDRPGAELLFGQGDMLLMTVENSNLQRLQGVFVSNDEIRRLVNYWKDESKKVPAHVYANTTYHNRTALQEMLMNRTEEEEVRESVGEYNAATGTFTYNGRSIENADANLGVAIYKVQKQNRASQTMLVTELNVGYSRAIKILLQMEELGVIEEQSDNRSNPWLVLNPDTDDGSERA